MVELLEVGVNLMLVVGEVVVRVEEGSSEGRGISGLILRMDLGAVEGMLGRRESIDCFY